MKRIFLVIALLMAASSIAPGQQDAHLQNRTMTNDEEALKQLVKEWADAAVHAEVAKLEKYQDANFRGSAEGVSYDRKMLAAAIRSGQMKVAAWTMDDVKVSIRRNLAVVTGRSTLSNATYMGKDFSGEWEWTDRFIKQGDGSWRAVSSQAKRIRK